MFFFERLKENLAAGVVQFLSIPHSAVHVMFSLSENLRNLISPLLIYVFIFVFFSSFYVVAFVALWFYHCENSMN